MERIIKYSIQKEFARRDYEGLSAEESRLLKAKRSRLADTLYKGRHKVSRNKYDDYIKLANEGANSYKDALIRKRKATEAVKGVANKAKEVINKVSQGGVSKEDTDNIINNVGEAIGKAKEKAKNLADKAKETVKKVAEESANNKAAAEVAANTDKTAAKSGLLKRATTWMRKNPKTSIIGGLGLSSVGGLVGYQHYKNKKRNDLNKGIDGKEMLFK